MIPDYYKNSILKFKTLEYTDKKGVTRKDGSTVKITAPDYHSIDFKKVHIMLDMCPQEWFEYIKIQNHTNIEKLSQDLYGSPNYWDILIVINGRMPLFEFPYDYDVIELMVDEMVDNYVKKIYKRAVTDETRERIRQMFVDKVANDNEKYRFLKVIKPENIYNFIQLGFEYEIFNNDND